MKAVLNDSGSRDAVLTLAATLRDIKRDLVRSGNTFQVAEAVPVESSAKFPAGADDLVMLHKFASENPIYHDSAESVLAGVRCVVYRGDINKYWLGSILHEASRAPFSPTWIASAYVLSRLALEMGYARVLDVGSGDGRIAFCASVLGLEAHGIEIDADLSGLQSQLSDISEFAVHCTDAASYDYAALDYSLSTVLFAGGLAQMGGETLVSMIMDRLAGSGCKMHGWVFAGTQSPKYAPDPAGMYGWGSMMNKTGLRHMRTLELPSAWTLDQPDDTQYVFAS